MALIQGGTGITSIRWFREPNLASPSGASLLEMNARKPRLGVSQASVASVRVLTIE